MSTIVVIFLMLILIPIVLFGDIFGCLLALIIFIGVIFFIGINLAWIIGIAIVFYAIKQIIYLVNYVKLPLYDDYLTLNNDVYQHGEIICSYCGSSRLTKKYLLYKNSPWAIVQCVDSKQYLFKVNGK